MAALRIVIRRAAILMSLVACGSCALERPETASVRNLVLITVDTLRPDRLSAYGAEVEIAPAIDRLASESTVFLNAFAHSSMTLPSIASLLTGVLPAQHGLLGNRGVLPAEIDTLGEVLRDRGYRTAAFIGNYALRPSRGLDAGFDRYTSRYLDRESVRAHPENLARGLTDEALAWVETVPHDQPFFLWVHYQEPHGPYTPPKFDPPARDPDELVLERSRSNSGRDAIPAYQWLGTGRLSEYLARYDGEIREVDRHIGRLLERLRTAGTLESAVVVFAADHGEAFGEDGLYCAHGQGLHTVLLRVPLMLRVPGRPPARREDRVRLIDVVPTVAQVLGLDAGSGWPGASLLDDQGDRPVVAMSIARRDNESWRALFDGPDSLTEQYGGIERAAGPGFEANAATGERFQRELDRLAPWPQNATYEDESEEELRSLRALGYVD